MLAMLVLVTMVAGGPIGNLLYKAGIEVTMTVGSRVRSWSIVKVLKLVFVVAPLEYRSDLWLSTKLGVGTATAAVAAALPLAWGMRHARGTPWVRLTALATCMTVPGPLLGVALIRLLNQPADSPLAFLGALYDSNFAPWLAQTIRALPLATLIVWPALASVPQAMLDLAATEGSGWWGQLLRVALPQRWPAVAAAWLVGFAIAVGELAATVLLMPPAAGGVTTISVRIFQMLHYGVDDRAAAVSLLMILAIAAITGAAAWMMTRTVARGRSTS
jgi:ABC-type Fe3+ transport system permease subunit